MADYVYGISIAQFAIGSLITALNSVLCIALATNPRLRTAPNCLLGNIWFSNLLLGIIIAVSNVVDDSNAYVFRKSEGTMAIINGFVNISMLLSLVTNRVITLRTPNRYMSTVSAFKIITATWVCIVFLTLVKTVLFALNRLGHAGACFECFLIFEVTTLVVATVTTLLIFCVSFYLICVHRNRTVSDSSTGGNLNHQKEYELSITVGCILLGFSLTFLAFVLLILVWLIKREILNVGISEIIITLFYTHCIINPIIALVRDSELRSTARAVIRRKHTVGPTGQGQGGGREIATIAPDVGRLQLRNHSLDRFPNDPTAPPLPAVETPTKTPRSDGYGSTEKVVIHDRTSPPSGGVHFLNG